MNRPEFLDFVTTAVRAAERPEIVGVDTLFAAVDDPSGLRITMTDGDVLLLRLLNTTQSRPVAPAPPPALPPVVPLPAAGGQQRVALGGAIPRTITSSRATPVHQPKPEGGD